MASPQSGRGQGVLLAAAIAYAGSAAISSIVAVRDTVPGEPFGLSIPLSVPAALVVGWGAGIAPPWYMPAAAIIAAKHARGGDPRPATIAALIGVASIAGHLIEPVTRRPTSWTPATRASIGLTITSSALLAAAGFARRHFR